MKLLDSVEDVVGTVIVVGTAVVLSGLFIAGFTLAYLAESRLISQVLPARK